MARLRKLWENECLQTTGENLQIIDIAFYEAEKMPSTTRRSQEWPLVISACILGSDRAKRFQAHFSQLGSGEACHQRLVLCQC